MAVWIGLLLFNLIAFLKLCYFTSGYFELSWFPFGGMRFCRTVLWKRAVNLPRGSPNCPLQYRVQLRVIHHSIYLQSDAKNDSPVFFVSLSHIFPLHPLYKTEAEKWLNSIHWQYFSCYFASSFFFFFLVLLWMSQFSAQVVSWSSSPYSHWAGWT